MYKHNPQQPQIEETIHLSELTFSYMFELIHF